MGRSKKDLGQFYTTECHYILKDLPGPPDDCKCIIEPFAGKGDLIQYIKTAGYTYIPIEAYDIDPKYPGVIERDTFFDKPDYTDAWVITNPPYLARNKSKDKQIYDTYHSNDLYKCFMRILIDSECRGGIIIIPAGFFLSSRDIDNTLRNDFMEKYTILRINYFEETVFNDTSTTVVAFSFIKSQQINKLQQVEWVIYPSGITKTFEMSCDKNWIIGGEVYQLPTLQKVSIQRHVVGQKLKDNQQQTFMTLTAIDSGTADGKIKMEYRKDYIYQAKESSRTYATLRITGKTLTEQQQIDLCRHFNDFIEQKREQTHSLFLPQYRESKQYARKRIPFELAYRIILYILNNNIKNT